jgi:serine/threonine protein kinase
MPKVMMPNMSGRVINQGRIKLLSQIGRGSFGVVYNAVDMTTPIPKLLAVKVLLKSNRNVKSQYREFLMHHAVSDNENIVKFHRVLQDSQYFYIVLDFLPGGDMWGAIRAGEYWRKDELVREVFLKLIDGLQHCHNQGVYHRDMKPNNILVGEDPSHVCISDFGLAAKAKQSQSFGVGTTQFRSPG